MEKKSLINSRSAAKKALLASRKLGNPKAVQPVDLAKYTPTVAKGTPQVAKGTPQVAKGTPQIAKGTPQIAKGTPQIAKGTLL